MGVFAISARRMFKALVLERHVVFAKLQPQAFKSMEIIRGDGVVDTIEKTTFAEGMESIVHEVKFEPGCKAKMTSHYHPKPGRAGNEEEVQTGKEKTHGLYKAVSNPNVHA